MTHSRLVQALLATFMTSLLMACSPKESASTNAPSAASEATTATAPVAPSAPVVAENELGKKMFNKTCSMCHAAGVGGAPKPGDKADWAPRIAQGKDTLYKHAMEGFNGNKGAMPARGGAPSMTDDEVKAAVDYMADKSI